MNEPINFNLHVSLTSFIIFCTIFPSFPQLLFIILLPFPFSPSPSTNPPTLTTIYLSLNSLILFFYHLSLFPSTPLCYHPLLPISLPLFLSQKTLSIDGPINLHISFSHFFHPFFTIFSLLPLIPLYYHPLLPIPSLSNFLSLPSSFIYHLSLLP